MGCQQGFGQYQVGDRRCEQRDPVECNWQRGKMVFARPSVDERNQREPEEQVDVGPEGRTIDAFDDLKQVMVVVPVNADIDIADVIAL